MDKHQTAVVGVAAFCAAAFARIPDLVKFLVMAQCLDMFSGMLYAWNKHCLSSTVARYGLTKKACMLLLVALGYCFDHTKIITVPIGPATAGYYAAMEIISLIENSGKLGIPIAPAIRRGLAVFQNIGKDDKDA